MHTKYLFPNQPLLSEMLPLVSHSFHWGIFSLQNTHTSSSSSLNLFLFLKMCLNVLTILLSPYQMLDPWGCDTLRLREGANRWGWSLKTCLQKMKENYLGHCLLGLSSLSPRGSPQADGLHQEERRKQRSAQWKGRARWVWP